MARKADITNSNGGTIKVGTTGTIGSLMTRELESMKHMPSASDASRKKTQTTQASPISVPCGTTPKKIQPGRNSLDGSGSSSGSGSGNHRSLTDAQKPRYATRRNGHKVPMLGSENINMDKNTSRDKPGKKGSPYTVEVVDLKCSNPMSSRLKKQSPPLSRCLEEVNTISHSILPLRSWAPGLQVVPRIAEEVTL